MTKEEINKAIQLYKANNKIRQIADKLGYHHKTISKYLKKSGIEIKNPGNTKSKPKLIIPNKIKDWHRDQQVIYLYKKNYSSIQIAKALEISKKTVLRILKKNNINRSNQYHIQKDSLKGKKTVINKRYNSGESIKSIAKSFKVREELISNLIINKRPTNITLSKLDATKRNKSIKLYQQGYSSYDIAELLNIDNPDIIGRFLKSQNLIRSKEEVKKLISQKLSNNSCFKSKPQKKLEEILKNNNIQYYPEFPLEGWNFDIKIKNSTLLIEVQGNYWHSFPARIKKDQKKKEIAKQNGFQTLFIWEHQINSEQFIIDLINYHLNNKCTDFTFSNLTIHQDRELAESLAQYHYYNNIGQSKSNYVACLNGEPIAACIFANIRRLESSIKQHVAPNEILELSRFIIHPNYHKKNFASWFIARCIKLLKKQHPNIKKLISFSDSTYNHDGIIYKALGWRLDGTAPSDYWYVTPNRSIIKKKTLYNRAKKEGLTEKEYARKMQCLKVYGHPKNRFIKEL